MKNKTQHATLGHGKSLKNILSVWNPINQNQKISSSKIIESFGGNNLLQNQNFGKAPPSRARSPGLGRGDPPENKGDPPVTITQHYNEYKYITKYQKLIFIHIKFYLS